MQRSHEGTKYPILPVVWLVSAAFRTVNDVLRLNVLSAYTHGFRGLTNHPPQSIIGNRNGSPPEFVFEAAVFRHLLTLFLGMVDNQSLIDADALFLPVHVRPAQSQKLTAGNARLQKQHQGEAARILAGETECLVVLLLRVGLLGDRGMICGELNRGRQRTFRAELIIHRRIEQEPQYVPVFLDCLRRVLLRRLVNVGLNVDGANFIHVQISKIRNEMTFQRFQIGSRVGVCLHERTLVQFQRLFRPDLKLDFLHRTAFPQEILHLVFHAIFLGFSSGVLHALTAVNGLSDAVAVHVFAEVNFDLIPFFLTHYLPPYEKLCGGRLPSPADIGLRALGVPADKRHGWNLVGHPLACPPAQSERAVALARSPSSFM